jgi:peroxiredoxin
MNLWTKRLEVAVNVALLGAFLMVAALAAQRFWNGRADSRAAGPEIGKKVSLANVDWSKSDRTLVLAISTTCHFCSESADFYKRLVPAAAGQGIPVIAALPQTTAESHSYLDRLGVNVQGVFQTSLQALGTGATPTVLVIDKNGRVSKAWVGKLGPEAENQVLASLR